MRVIKYILFVPLVMILPLSLAFRIIFFNEEDTKRAEVLWEKRCEKGKLPLKKFNNEIFINIAFSGVFIRESCSRQESGCDPGGSYWFEVKLDRPVIRGNSATPSVIPFIYDFTVNPVKIYYRLSQPASEYTLTYAQQKKNNLLQKKLNKILVNTEEKHNERIEKRIGEIFIRIYPNDSGDFYKIYYSPSLKYFWETDNKSELKYKVN